MKNWIINYLYNFTMALNRFLNAVFGGLYDEEISLRTAKADKKGKLWAVYFGKFLNWVDHGHLEKTLRGEKTGYGAGLRILALLLIVFYAIMRIV